MTIGDALPWVVFWTGLFGTICFWSYLAYREGRDHDERECNRNTDSKGGADAG